MKMFWSACSRCKRQFVVAEELRQAGSQVICPYCDNRYLPEGSAGVDRPATGTAG